MTQTDGSVAEGLEDERLKTERPPRQFLLLTWTWMRWRNPTLQKPTTCGGPLWTEKKREFKTARMFGPGRAEDQGCDQYLEVCPKK